MINNDNKTPVVVASEHDKNKDAKETCCSGHLFITTTFIFTSIILLINLAIVALAYRVANSLKKIKKFIESPLGYILEGG